MNKKHIIIGLWLNAFFIIACLAVGYLYLAKENFLIALLCGLLAMANWIGGLYFINKFENEMEK